MGSKRQRLSGIDRTEVGGVRHNYTSLLNRRRTLREHENFTDIEGPRGAGCSRRLGCYPDMGHATQV